jgi:hypothetical protein
MPRRAALAPTFICKAGTGAWKHQRRVASYGLAAGRLAHNRQVSILIQGQLTLPTDDAGS